MSTARDVAIFFISSKLHWRIREYYGKYMFFLVRTHKNRVQETLTLHDKDYSHLTQHINRLVGETYKLKIGSKFNITTNLTIVYHSYTFILKVGKSTFGLSIKEYEELSTLSDVITLLCIKNL